VSDILSDFRPLPTAHCPLPTAHWPLKTGSACFSLLTAYCLLFSIFYFLFSALDQRHFASISGSRPGLNFELSTFRFPLSAFEPLTAH
jgi:hypothetical protein